MISRWDLFQGLASKWDTINPSGPQAAAIDRGLDLLEPLGPLARRGPIADVGCGTGAAVGRLLPRLDLSPGKGAGPGPKSEAPRVIAIDFAPEMIARATALHPDPRVEWRACDVLASGILPGSCAAVLCYNAFPHFPDASRAADELARWLLPGGRLLVWHDKPRAVIAEIHRKVGGPVGQDAPLPVEETAALFAQAGLRIDRAEEPPGGWLLLATRPGGSLP